MAHVDKPQVRPGKETIHSGHFMVSHFEAEAQDDFDDLAVPVPDEEQNIQKVTVLATYKVPGALEKFTPEVDESKQPLKQNKNFIETSLTKLFRCMSLAYRQKLTSPKWNRFKGIKLTWKDKIRLNNVIWRCWHMQFIKKQNTLVCQFASPLDVDTHVKPETTILEGKYWKRRAEAVTAEYKKWRMFHIMRFFGKGDTIGQDPLSDMDTVESFSQCEDFAASMMTDEDYLTFMSDTLFSTISNHQPFAFPDCREIARGASLADFIQPSLGPLQPNLDDFMDTYEPLQELLSTPRLPPVPEESAVPPEEPYRVTMAVQYTQPYIAGQTASTMAPQQMNLHGTTNNTQMMSIAEQNVKNEQMRLYEDQTRMYAQTDMQNNMMGQEIIYPNTGYNAAQETQMQGALYTEKTSRVQYIAAPKMIAQTDTTYNKYNAAIPPSQTAPETVSLLQQPLTARVTPPARHAREKPRPRQHHYTQPITTTSTYQQQASYTPLATQGQPVTPPYDPPRARTSMQYLQPQQEYKAKPIIQTVNSRAFKLPSPPLTGVQQVATAAPSTIASRNKEQFRSHSLPLGAQLNPDWSVSAPAQTHEAPAVRQAGRPREPVPASLRLRSRSSSGGLVAEPRRPPPLNSVASEPTLPQASVMLAQLLSAQHSQSLLKLNSVDDADPTISPIRRGQPSPIGSEVMSPHHSLSPPTSPGSPRCGSPREPRRAHLHAEQKRRYNIKNGFDTLQALIPHLHANPATKISKAAMLQKGAEYIKQLKAERNQIKEEMENLRQQIESLNNSISNCHSLLPATGAPVSRARASRLREMFARHVANRTMHNWKYWLFSVVSAALVDSFSACVSCGSGADLVRTTLLWAEQHCSLVEMRPAVLSSLRVLCTTTDILTNPERLPDEAVRAVASHAGVKTEPS